MDDDSWPERDLWGEPGRAPPDPRGRKRHKRLPQIAETVALLRATDMSIEDIATQVGLSAPTLQKYYFRELDKGPSLARGRMLERLYRAGMAGSVTAMNRYLILTERGQAAPPPVRRKAAEAKPEALGKKAEADQAALTAHEGTEWGELLH